MTKKKASIFTVVEAVPNWSEANQEIVAIQEATHVTVTQDVGASCAESSQVREVLTPTAEISHSWARSDLYTWKSAKVAEGEAIRAEDNRTETEWAEPSWAECDSVPWTEAGIPEVTPDWAKVHTEEHESADVADPRIGQTTHNVGIAAEDGTSKWGEVTQETFWALLQAAGYEVW